MKSTREQLQRLARMSAMVFILGSVAFLSAITTIRIAIQGREVEMPSVVAKKAGDAQTELAARELGMRIVDHVYSDQPVDHIVRQRPQAGTRVKVPQRVHVVLSLGPRHLSIPDLEGKSLRAAKIELLRAALQTGQISTVQLPGYEPERVVQQSPRAGDATTGSARVNLLVAMPERPPSFVMPDLAGLSLPEAQRRLSAARLRLGSLALVATSGALRGTVVGHTPPRGARVESGTLVELQLAEPSVPPGMGTGARGDVLELRRED